MKTSMMDGDFIVVDYQSDYITQTQITRHFTPSGMPTPLDDIYLEVKLRLCPGHVPPSSLGLTAEIEALRTNGLSISPVVQGIGFSLRAYGSDYAIYRAELDGWNSLPQPRHGFTTATTYTKLGNTYSKSREENFEDLIDSAKNAGDLINLVLTDSGGSVVRYITQLSACFHLVGPKNAPRLMSLLRGNSHPYFDYDPATTDDTQPPASSGFEATRYVTWSLDAAQQIFGFDARSTVRGLDPYAYYYPSGLLAMELDLSIHNDQAMPVIVQQNLEMYLDYWWPRGGSACGSGRWFYAANVGSDKIGDNYSRMLAGVAYIVEGEDGYTIAHEAGHAVCNLNDEYLVGAWSTQGSANTNCGRPEDFWISPGRPSPVCPFCANLKAYYSGWHTGCISSNLVRPANDSLMRSTANKFNTVSCGYCAAAINGDWSRGKSYFDLCSRLDVVDRGVGTAVP